MQEFILEENIASQFKFVYYNTQEFCLFVQSIDLLLSQVECYHTVMTMIIFVLV